MVQDHTKAGDELKAIAQKLGYKPARKPEAKKKEDVIEMMKRLSDDEFDMAYAKNQVMAHEQAVKMFRRQAQQGDAEELKQYAAKSLPVLEEHLKMEKSLPPMKKAMEEKKK
jgi:putative membrane protein